MTSTRAVDSRQARGKGSGAKANDVLSAEPATTSGVAGGILALQRTAGNSAVTQLLMRLNAQAQPAADEIPPPDLETVARRPNRGGKLRGARVRTDQDLQDLAHWPNEAHTIWKRLSPDQQRKVVDHMTRRYGEAFSAAFEVYAKAGVTDQGQPSYRPYHTPEWFHARGYQLGEQAGGAYGEISGQWPWQQWWVHPSGTVIYQQFGSSPAKGQSGAAGGEGGGEDGRVPPPDDPDPFGDVLADCQQRQEAVQGFKDQLKRLDSKSQKYAQLYAAYAKALSALEAQLKTTMDAIEKITDNPKTPQKVKDARNADWQEFNEVKFWVDQEQDPDLDPAATGHEAAPKPPVR